MEYDPRELERRWRERWRAEGRYEPDPPDAAAETDDETTFITVPYPYPSGGMHIGHCRTYTVPDVYARYRRQRGDEVLFPMAWHVTGTPIIGAVERLKEGEPEQLSVLRDTYNVPEETLDDLETPMGYARHFIENHYKSGMRRLGLSIDWRREFTTNDERYSKFVTWQYATLNDRNRLERGLHPVKYCTNENQPVTTHDLLEGEEAEFQEYTLIRFSFEDEGDAEGGGESGRVIAPMATLRPETVRGVTNAYVDPDAAYVHADVDGERWFVSRAAVERLRLQDRAVTVRREVRGGDLVGRRVRNPITGETVPVLPASFVDPDNATGVVMSVPAHSPDDYVALREVTADAGAIAAEHGLDADEIRGIEPVSILEIEGYGDVPAADAVAAAGIESSSDPGLHEVTQELYNDEFHAGRLSDAYGEFAGRVVEDVREEFHEHHAGDAFGSMYEFSEPVVCRCGGDVEVAYRDTWFLRYGDEDWKAKAKRAIERMDAIPENTRGEYTHTVDWLNEWPCIRNYGLGTRLPWDDDFVIEPLSDSTIYMAYYTIAHRLREIPVEELDRAFFDALFYGPDAVDDPDPRALELREEWLHWYPVSYRFSANDLISNHLTFYLFHHAELFDEPQWPAGIVVMGMGLLEGEKMSSSKGHVVLPDEAIDEYGADTVRFFLLNSGDPWQDFDWRASEVSSVRDSIERFWNRAVDLIDDGPTASADGGEPGAGAGVTTPGSDLERRRIDRWLLSRLQATIREVTDALEGAETRGASQAAFYGFEEELRWYRRRTDRDRPAARRTLRRVLATRLRLLAPFVPFLANELHERLTGEPAEDAGWPEPDPALDAPGIELEEARIEALADDVADIVDVTDRDPETIRVYVAAGWKRRVFDAVAEAGDDLGAVMGRAMEEPSLRERGDAVNDLAGDLIEFARGRDDDELDRLRGMDERAVYERARPFLEREFDADVELYVEGEDAAGDDPADRAADARPFRPAIHIE